MRKADCVDFLKWCLPRLGLRWPGYRKVRGTVCKRISRRLRALGLDGVADYRRYLESHPEEWGLLDSLCRIPISRFWRDRDVFEWLAERGLPALAERAKAGGRTEVRCWSAGCASGEEVYSLRLAWLRTAARRHPGIRFSILATDVDETMLERARAGRYQSGSLRDLPASCLERGFVREDGTYRVRDAMRDGIAFRQQDIRKTMPAGPFDLILCRNLAFTYFDAQLQSNTLSRVLQRLRPGGLFVIGAKEALPAEGSALTRADGDLPIFVAPKTAARSH